MCMDGGMGMDHVCECTKNVYVYMHTHIYKQMG